MNVFYFRSTINYKRLSFFLDIHIKNEDDIILMLLSYYVKHDP